MSESINTKRTTAGLLSFMLMFLLLTVPANAVTLDEIIQMDQSGVSPEIIIEVIDATGLEDGVMISDLEFLAEVGVDTDVIVHLVKYLSDEETESLSENGEESRDSDTDRSNRLGGEGFHHNRGDSYRNQQYSNEWYDYRNRYGYGYRHERYIPDRGITVYSPPVYILDNDPYYRAWRVPRYYGHGYGGYVIIDGEPVSVHLPWNYGKYHLYDDYYRYRRHHYRGAEWGGITGGIRYDGRYDDWDSWLGAFWHDDDFSIGIRF